MDEDTELKRQQDRIRNLAASLADALEYLKETEGRTSKALDELETAASRMQTLKDSYRKDVDRLLSTVHGRLDAVAPQVAAAISGLVAREAKTVVDAAGTKITEATQAAHVAVGRLRTLLDRERNRLFLYSALGGAAGSAVVALAAYGISLAFSPNG
ncbi:hypothetical protein [Aquabacterium sp.]|uniref:hypothetical protein n=1 Tax=Aquabacterium sp. TaxID=1872578 RepID=UPI003D6CE321